MVLVRSNFQQKTAMT